MTENPIRFSSRRRHLLQGAGAVTLLAASPAWAWSGRYDKMVKTVADLVERDYPDPTLARQIAAGVRNKLRSNRYAISDPNVLARTLTEDLRQLGHDQHLAVTYDLAHAQDRTPATAPPATSSPPTPKNPSARARAVFEPEGYGLSKVELLAGNIGLLQIDNFVPLYDLVRARIGAAMELLSNSWGLILDLRTTGGGTSDTPAYLVSYFFDRPPFVLNRMVWRHQPEERIETSQDLVGPRYGEGRPLIVTTSPDTFSAAEAVAYGLQSTRRATIVGQRSRGGANPGDFFNVGDGFVAFCPQGRAIDMATGGNWEGVGVQPDIVTSPADTLRVAHRTAVERAKVQAKDADTIEALDDALKTGPYPID
jgi:retinol-binding protein 3